MLNQVVFHRHCAAKGLDAKDVGRELKRQRVIPKNSWGPFLRGETRRGAKVFGAIGKMLGHEASTYMVEETPPKEVKHRVHAYARRLEDLILSGAIPASFRDPDSDEEVRTDVFEYVTHLNDDVLSTTPLTEREKHEAFHLAKHWDVLEEGPLEFKNGILRTIGPMRIAPFDTRLIQHDLAQRHNLEIQAVKLLKQSRDHWQKTRDRFQERYEDYCALAPEKIDRRTPFEVAIEDAIHYDWRCRKAILICGNDDAALEARYRRVHFAISTLASAIQASDARRKRAVFPRWWKRVYFKNRDSLTRLQSALGASHPNGQIQFKELLACIDENALLANRIVEAALKKSPTSVATYDI